MRELKLFETLSVSGGYQFEPESRQGTVTVIGQAINNTLSEFQVAAIASQQAFAEWKRWAAESSLAMSIDSCETPACQAVLLCQSGNVNSFSQQGATSDSQSGSASGTVSGPIASGGASSGGASLGGSASSAATSGWTVTCQP